MKDYLSFEGLSHFFVQLLNKFSTKEELSNMQDDVITDDEIDSICGSTLEFDDALIDEVTV